MRVGTRPDAEVARSYGISAVPTLLLVGPDGKVVLSDPSLSELTKKVDEPRGK